MAKSFRQIAREIRARGFVLVRTEDNKRYRMAYIPDIQLTSDRIELAKLRGDYDRQPYGRVSHVTREFQRLEDVPRMQELVLAAVTEKRKREDVQSIAWACAGYDRDEEE